MPSKQILDKAAWEWAKTADIKNISTENCRTAYRLNITPCKQGFCKRNCKGNPFCINGIGEKIWFSDFDEKKFHDIEDPSSERREEGKFIGLKNLGATCYVNTFLQLWFHNKNVREAIYRWREPGMEDEYGEYKPNTLCGHLQLIFMSLEFSKRRVVDPTPLINFLGLNTGEQQDAQEFSKLFLSLLESNFSSHSTCTANMVEELFCGQYAYVTKCQNCGGISKNISQFYELDLPIQGHRVLEDCIDKFLQEEKLEGDNQYMCSHCNKKQDAIRFIQLQKLPPVLHLQLLRFVYDVNNGHKKKLNSFVQFPDEIHLDKYLSAAEKDLVYELTAVLIHRGPSAYSGHYIAHIKDSEDHLWYKFNDEEIEQVKGRNLRLGNEEEINLQEAKSQTSKTPRTPKGYHSSRNAYMLVYTLKQYNSEDNSQQIEWSFDNLPVRVKKYIQRDNDNLEHWITDLLEMKLQNLENGRETREEIQQIYKDLYQCNDSDSEWICTDWLHKWLTEPKKAPDIDNRTFLCPHNRVDPDQVVKLKCIPKKSADLLYSKYSGGPRLVCDQSICEECVYQRCKVIQIKEQMAEDEKLFSRLLKFTYESADCYWIGKASFRSWKKLALEKVGEYEPYDEMGVYGGLDEITENGEEDCRLKFNRDLLCDDHDNLSADESCRRLVPAVVWDRLVSYFPDCPKFNYFSSVCAECQLLSELEVQEKDQIKSLALRQKAALLDLFHGRNRPDISKLSSEIYVINSEFLSAWTKFLRDTVRNEPVTEIINKTLICGHNKLLHPVDVQYTEDDKLFELIWPKEWESIKQHFSIDQEIVIRPPHDEASAIIQSIPEVCTECVQARLLLEESEKYNYIDAVIFIRKSANDMNTSTSISNNKSEDNDSNSEYTQGTKKRKKASGMSEDINNSIPRTDDVSKRKSQRHRKMRGEKQIKVSSSETLKDLKIEIMKQFSVPPFDQNLSLDGVVLSDDTASLRDLKVYRGCVIYLKADEAPADELFAEEFSQGSPATESGFKGTGLLGNS